MKKQSVGLGGAVGNNREATGVIRFAQQHVEAVREAGVDADFGDLLKHVPLSLQPLMREKAAAFARECAAMFITTFVQTMGKFPGLQVPQSKSMQSTPSAYRVGKSRGEYEIHCANGVVIYLADCRASHLLVMMLANPKVSIPYEFLVQAGETGPWKLGCADADGKWVRSSSAGKNEGGSDSGDDLHVSYEDDLHPAGNVMLDATDRETLDECYALLAKIKEQREEAVLDHDQKMVAKLDEQEKGIRKYIRDVTDKYGKIRKQGWNRKVQRQLHACIERVIERISDQDEVLGAFLGQVGVVERGACFRFNGSADDFHFETGVLKTAHAVDRAAVGTTA